MKTLLVLVIICCASQKDGVYTYEAKDVKTNLTGQLHSEVKYQEGDTVKLNIGGYVRE